MLVGEPSRNFLRAESRATGRAIAALKLQLADKEMSLLIAQKDLEIKDKQIEMLKQLAREREIAAILSHFEAQERRLNHLLDDLYLRPYHAALPPAPMMPPKG